MSFPGLLGDQRVVALVRHRDAAVAEEIVRAAVDGGLRTVEVTLTVPGAVGLIERLRGELPPSVVVGAGTVVDADQVRSVVSAGAQFVVSPVLAEPMVAAAHQAGVPAVPGVLTPTEAYQAQRLGCDTIKLYPASTVGPGHLSGLRDVLPGLAVFATGGVDATNAATWLAAGACGVGIGGAFGAAHSAGGAGAVVELTRRLLDVSA